MDEIDHDYVASFQTTLWKARNRNAPINTPSRRGFWRAGIDMHGWEEQHGSITRSIAGGILARNISQFRIIHGKGEGTLRQALRDRLNAMKTEGTVIIWGPGRTDGDTDADSLEAVSWFTVS